MPTEALTCPQCGGADPSPADDHGVHQCAYCGVRYRVVAGAPTSLPGSPGAGLPHRPWAAAVALGVLVLIFAVAIWAARAFEEPPPGPQAGALPATGSAAVDPEVPVDQPAPAEVAPSASFAQHSVASSVGTSFYVLGMVTNTSEAPIGKVEVHVVLLDADGREVFADHGYSADDVLAPGESCPIAVLVSDPPAYDRFETTVQARTPLFTPDPAPGLVVRPLEPTRDHASWRFAGSVENTGEAPARFVEVRVTGWDAEDRLVGLAHTYAAGSDALAPGATARYATSHPIWAGTPTRFETTVRGRVAD